MRLFHASTDYCGRVYAAAAACRVLIASFFIMASALAGAQPAPAPAPALIPQPREFHTASEVGLRSGVAVVAQANAEDRFTAEDLVRTLRERGIAVATPTAAAVVVDLMRLDSAAAKRELRRSGQTFSAEMQTEGYVIACHGKTMAVIGATAAGLFYGAQTVKQLVRGRGKDGKLQLADIRDWPAMRYRGADDDLSRGPFPTVDFQKRQIRTLAAFKINIYSPYFEDAFAYKSDPLSWLPGAALSPDEAAELVRYAALYHVTIVPQQEAFGHLHHLLTNEQYAQVAETPMGMVLAPRQPNSIALIKSLFQQLAAVFPSPFLHIGADETFDLGAGQSAAEVKQRGLGAVYIDFLTQIYDALAPLHRRLLFWGDMAMNEPALVPKLPKDMIAVAWHYSPEPNGFGPWLQPYVRAGMETWVAPGANNWSQVYPNNDMTLKNVQGFVRDGQKEGSTGMLMTVWNDDGEGLYQQDWYGVLFAAAAGWQPGESGIAQYQQAYGPVFHGDWSGRIESAQSELMLAHQTLQKAGVGDGTDALFWIDPWSAGGQAVSQKILPFAAELRLHAERAISLIAEAEADGGLREQDALDAMDLGARRMDFIGLKFETAQSIVDGYNRAMAAAGDATKRDEVNRELSTITGSDGRCGDLQEGYNYLRDQYREVWLRENRPYWLGNVMDRYNAAAELWLARSRTFSNAQAKWEQTRTLPEPEVVGIPAAAKVP